VLHSNSALLRPTCRLPKWQFADWTVGLSARSASNLGSHACGHHSAVTEAVGVQRCTFFFPSLSSMFDMSNLSNIFQAHQMVHMFTLAASLLHLAAGRMVVPRWPQQKQRPLVRASPSYMSGSKLPLTAADEIWSK